MFRCHQYVLTDRRLTCVCMPDWPTDRQTGRWPPEWRTEKLTDGWIGWLLDQLVALASWLNERPTDPINKRNDKWGPLFFFPSEYLSNRESSSWDQSSSSKGRLAHMAVHLYSWLVKCNCVFFLDSCRSWQLLRYERQFLPFWQHLFEYDTQIFSSSLAAWKHRVFRWIQRHRSVWKNSA